MKTFIGAVCFFLFVSTALALPILNIREFGAAGDGIADDSAALKQAAERLKSNGGGTLEFPAGTYRIGTVGGGLILDEQSNVKVVFADGAVLLMDNLLPDGNGGGHGITVRGPAKNIELHNIKVQWKNKARTRSNGDGFRFEGYPDSRRTLKRIRMENCQVQRSAQTGAVFMGCSDVTVKNFTIRESWGDGLHFNACRNVEVEGVTGIQTGDDTLAFVTYYAEKPEGKTGTVFALPDLGEWNNSGSVARHVRSTGGNADGIRISGARAVKISDVEVDSKVGCGIIIDAGMISKINLWQYLASRNIEINDVKVKNCNTGLYIMQFDPAFSNPDFYEFDVRCGDFQIENCDNDSVHLSGVSGVELADFLTTGCRWRFRTIADCRLRNADIREGAFLIIGQDEAIDPARIEQLHDCNIRVSNLKITHGNLGIQRCRNLGMHNLEISGSPGSSVSVFQTLESGFSELKLENMNLAETTPFAVQILQSRNIHFDKVDVISSKPLTAAFELGGGDENLTTDLITIEELAVQPSGMLPVLSQTGPYGVTHWQNLP